MKSKVKGSNEIEQLYLVIAINWTHSLYMRVPDQKVAKLKLNLHGIFFLNA
jgi:hypothetical protein